MFNSNGWQLQDDSHFQNDSNPNRYHSNDKQNVSSHSPASFLSGGGHSDLGAVAAGNGGYGGSRMSGDRPSQAGTSLFHDQNSQSNPFGNADGSGNGNGLGADGLFEIGIREESNTSSGFPAAQYGLLPRNQNAAPHRSQAASQLLQQQNGSSVLDQFSHSDLFDIRGHGGVGRGGGLWSPSSTSASDSNLLSSHSDLRNVTAAPSNNSNLNTSRNNGLGFEPDLGQEFGHGSSSSPADLLMPSPEIFSSSQTSSSSSSSSSFDHWGIQTQINSSQGDPVPERHSTVGLNRSKRPCALNLEGLSPSVSDELSPNSHSPSRSSMRGSNPSTRGVTPVRSIEQTTSSNSTGGAVVLTPQAKARYSSDFYPHPQSESRIPESQLSNEPSPLQVQSSSFSSHKPSPSISETSRFEGSSGLSNLQSIHPDFFGARGVSQDFSSSQSQSQPSLRSTVSHANLRTESPHASIGGGSQGSYQGGDSKNRQHQVRPPISPKTAMSMGAAQGSPSLTLWGAFGGRESSGGSMSRPSSSGLRSVASFTSSTGSGQTSASNSNSGSGVGGESQLLNFQRQRSSTGSSAGGSAVGGTSSQLPPGMHRSNSSSASSFATSDSSNSSDVSYQNPLFLHNQERANSGTWKGSSQLGARQGHDLSHHLSLDVNMGMHQDSPRSTGDSLASTSSYESSPNPAHQFSNRSSAAMPEFDMAYHEAHLSAALAANQINPNSRARTPPPSQTAGTGSIHGHEGHRTPTILEEEESELQHQHEQFKAMKIARMQHQQQQQQHSRSQSQQLAQRPNSSSRPASAGSGISLNNEFAKDPRSVSPTKQSFQAPGHQAQRNNEQMPSRAIGGLSASLDFSESMTDCSPYISSVVREYLESPSRLGLGERTVMVMTSRVAQKSYGNEKRFLCPPPMVLIIGASWWSALPDVTPSTSSTSVSPLDVSTVLAPPQVQVSMSGEAAVLDASLEWSSSSGRQIDVGNPSSEMAISARYIGKQLHITDVDDRKAVEALVHITVPGKTALDRHSLGAFASKPIKVISKPSKKRQAKGSTELCINHGSTISLFHRVRSQTVSTKYLCVSSPPTWFKGSDGRPFSNPNVAPNRNEPPSCFVAKTSSWEPFIIYRVDPTKGPDFNPSGPTIKGYPPPPPNVFPVNSENAPIKFNQPVVLQCLHTAVVSPVMIIRKIEKGNSAAGGGSFSSTDIEAWNYKEAFGDPVAQLNKVAFELVEDLSSVINSAPNSSQSGSEGDSSPGASGPFLACLNENVGMHKPAHPRRWSSSRPSTPPTPLTPLTQDSEISMPKSSSSLGGMMEGTPPTSPTSLAVAYAAAQTRQSMSQEGRHNFSSSSSTDAQLPPPSSDGGKVAKRPRRVSSLVGVQRGPPISSPSSGRGRRRGQSLSMVGMQNQMSISQQQQQQRPQDLLHRTTSYAHSLSTSSSAASVSSPGGSWSVDVGDQDIWTIVSADVASHTFYVPPRLVGGSQPSSTQFDPKVAHLISSPAPAMPITPIPTVELVIPPQPPRASSEGGGNAASAGALPCVTLIGENFTPQLFVFFGEHQSERVELHSSETIACTPPPTHDSQGNPIGKVPVFLVRHDGIIFPTRSFFPPLES